MRTVFLLLGSLWVGLLLAFAGALRGPLVRLVRALLAGIAAILAIAGAAAAAAGISSEAWWAVVAGAGMVLVALRLAWALRRPRCRRVEPVDHVPLTRPQAGSPWDAFEAQLDWVGRQQARRARAAIDGFIAERESPSLTIEQRALLLSCERRVPELLDAVAERSRNASRSERLHYIDDTLGTLVRIGGEAERARREVREVDDRRLQVLHRYFDGIAGPGDEPPAR